jgi:hypothetical protein
MYVANLALSLVYVLPSSDEKVPYGLARTECHTVDARLALPAGRCLGT